MEVSPALITLAFEGHPIRCFEVGDVMEWVAADVCAAVKLSGSTRTKAIERLAPDEKVTRTTVVLGRRLQLVTVTEAGLYHLLSHSDNAFAKRFKRWLCREVLPAINPGSKDGSIEAALAAADRQIQQLNERLELAEFREKENKLALLSANERSLWSERMNELSQRHLSQQRFYNC